MRYKAINKIKFKRHYEKLKKVKNQVSVSGKQNMMKPEKTKLYSIQDSIVEFNILPPPSFLLKYKGGDNLKSIKELKKSEPVVNMEKLMAFTKKLKMEKYYA